jgi:hypothetical protein
MGINLGNFSVEQIEYRAGVTFSDEIKTKLKATRQNRASNLGEKEWHCFDIPFIFVCGSMEFAKEVYKMLEPYAGDFEVPMEIAVSALKG